MGLLVQEKTKTLKSDIRKELRVFFPYTDFKISSKQEDERLQITLRYTDGPSRSRVRNITRQFAHTFHAERKPVKICIDVERVMSEKTRRLLLAEMKSVWNVKGNLLMDDHFLPINGTVKDYIGKIFAMRDF